MIDTDAILRTHQGVRAIGELAIYMAVVYGKLVENVWELHTESTSIYASWVDDDDARVRVILWPSGRVLLSYRRSDADAGSQVCINPNGWLPEFMRRVFNPHKKEGNKNDTE